MQKSCRHNEVNAFNNGCANPRQPHRGQYTAVYTCKRVTLGLLNHSLEAGGEDVSGPRLTRIPADFPQEYCNNLVFGDKYPCSI